MEGQFPDGGVLASTWRRHRLATARLRGAPRTTFLNAGASPGFGRDAAVGSVGATLNFAAACFLEHDGPVVWITSTCGGALVTGGLRVCPFAQVYPGIRVASMSATGGQSVECSGFFLHATHAQRNVTRRMYIWNYSAVREGGNSRRSENRRVSRSARFPDLPSAGALKAKSVLFQRVGVP